MNKLFKFSLFLMLLGAFAVALVSCGNDDEGGTPEPEPEPTENPPTITSVDPATGLIGAAVTINGTNLNTVTTVTFGSTAATIGSQSATSISTTVPEGLEVGEVEIKVVNPDGEATADFTVEAEPCEYEEDPICFCDQNPEAVECTLLLNGGFEEGEGDDFTNWSKNNGADFMTATTIETQVYSGSRALKVAVIPDELEGTPATQQWRIQLISEAVETEVDANYLIVVWARATVPGGTIRFSTNAGLGNEQYGPDTEVPSNWTAIQWEITANTATTTVVLDMAGDLETTYYIDDARILKLPASEE